MISGHQWDRQHWRIEQGAPSENLSKSEHAHRTPRTEDECAGFWHRPVRRFASAKPAPKQAPSNAGGRAKRRAQNLTSTVTYGWLTRACLAIGRDEEAYCGGGLGFAPARATPPRAQR